MKITSLRVGPIQTNCYLLCDEKAGVCAVIDPGDEPQRICDAIKSSGCTPCAVYLTHGHFDHCTAVQGLLAAYPTLEVYIHEADIGGGELRFARLPAQNARCYDEGDVLTLGSVRLRVMHTPGHSEGSVCLVTDGVIFCGDTLFCGSCGRTDLAGGSYEKILRSLARLAALEGDYTCLCGHDRQTTLDTERAHNPYMRHALGL